MQTNVETTYLNERRASKKEPAHIRHDVITYHHGDRHQKPYHTIEEIGQNQMWLSDNNQQGYVSPTKLKQNGGLLHNPDTWGAT